MSVLHWLVQRLKALLMLPVALLILFEEWGWEPAKRAMAWAWRAGRVVKKRVLQRWRRLTRSASSPS